MAETIEPRKPQVLFSVAVHCLQGRGVVVQAPKGRELICVGLLQKAAMILLDSYQEEPEESGITLVEKPPLVVVKQ